MKSHYNNPNSGKVVVRSPSNIAFIKYWGKRYRQLPLNPSLSMTLSQCYTDMEIDFSMDNGSPGINEFYFEGKTELTFQKRLQTYLQSITDIYPLANKLKLTIKSSNSFPHSTGIASSASAMSAFTFGLAHIKSFIEGGEVDINAASEMGRLASGSACRSFFKHYSTWGTHANNAESSDHYATEFVDYHSSFSRVNDAIVVIDDNQKSVSSSAGHQLMNAHPFKEARILQAHDNFRDLCAAMKDGNWEVFGEILELEALTLHSLMMSSSPSYILLAPNSIELIHAIRRIRQEHDIPLYFTIDAGPNLHLIYPDSIQNQVTQFLDEYKHLYKKVIYDHISNHGCELL